MKTKVRYKKYGNFPDMDTVKEILLYGIKNGEDRRCFIYNNFNDEIEEKNYVELKHDTVGLAQYFYKLGLKGKKVAILGDNSYYWAAIFYALSLGNFTVIPLDAKLGDEDIAELMVRSKCDAICYTNHFDGCIENMKNTDGVVIKNYIKFEDFDKLVEEGHEDLNNGAMAVLDDTVDPDKVSYIVFTSGTTGKSKGVMLTQKNVAADVEETCRAMTASHALAFLPFNHTFSWASGLLAAPLLSEWGYICKNLRNIQKDMVNYHPQNFSAVPLAVETVYKQIWITAKKTGKLEILKKGIKLSNTLLKLGIDLRRKIFKEVITNLGGDLELIISGGAFLDSKYEQGLYDLGIQVVNGYGITECSPVVTVNRLDEFKFGSAGKPLSCNEIKILDPDEEGVGEVLVRGKNVMKGYYEDPEATEEAFIDGWFRTGDYGYIDNDGFLFLKGRKKNLIVLSNGKNVSPEELEEKLISTIEYIKEVLVYEENSQITAEFYLDESLEPDAKNKIKEDVNEFNKNMPVFKQIYNVKIRDEEFPKTTTLKIRRNYNK